LLVHQSIGVLVSYVQLLYLKDFNISDWHNYITYKNHLLYKRETILNFIWKCYVLSGCPADIKAYQRPHVITSIGRCFTNW